MAKTQGEQLRELAAFVAELDARLRVLTERVSNSQSEIDRCTQRFDEFIAKFAVIEERLTQLVRADEQLRAEVNLLREELRRALDRLAVSEAKNAALDERARHGEKATDRGWQLWLAALGFGFGLISLLVTASLQLKK